MAARWSGAFAISLSVLGTFACGSDDASSTRHSGGGGSANGGSSSGGTPNGGTSNGGTSNGGTSGAGTGGSGVGGDSGIPADRRVPWSPGIAGGIPSYPRAGGATLDVKKSYGAVGDGSADDTGAINAAISAAKTGDVVYFPAGK